MAQDNLFSNYYTWILVLGIVGGILFLTTEFAGYVAPPYYYWYSIYLGTSNPDHLPYVPAILLVAILFFINAAIGAKKINLLPFDLPFDLDKIGVITSIGILAISGLGGIAFEVIMNSSGATNWWLGASFYAGVIGGGLLLVFYYLLGKFPKI
jgi:hypothetical protein